MSSITASFRSSTSSSGPTCGTTGEGRRTAGPRRDSAHDPQVGTSRTALRKIATRICQSSTIAEPDGKATHHIQLRARHCRLQVVGRNLHTHGRLRRHKKREKRERWRAEGGDTACRVVTRAIGMRHSSLQVRSANCDCQLRYSYNSITPPVQQQQPRHQNTHPQLLVVDVLPWLAASSCRLLVPVRSLTTPHGKPSSPGVSPAAPCGGCTAPSRESPAGGE